ncbi:hypothetical protein [Pseudomonas sp. 5Ae-yellow]|uniref:hypothetical protein n=1 Tax=Pseudomonas sp. 5Ae-yellow TaxID=2759848 RepID=UPI0015F56EF6|nr:hypothetical protein [Pseudomonas sp. 5Ae-yellow]MBA6419613.1 hypothetical protein [Pseudomonas sp. 5Ae-yellow]
MNSRQRLENRGNTQVITLSGLAMDFPEPERLRLQLSARVRKKPLDVGSLAYFIRGKNVSSHDDRGTPVVIESFVESRRELILRLLESFIGQRDTTVASTFLHVEHLIDWLNAQGYKEVFASVGHAQQAYRDYTAYLNDKIAHQKWKPRTAINFQVGVVKVIDILYPEESHRILAGAVRINGERGSDAASAAHVELYRDVCLSIAQQCSAFLLDNKPYPFVVRIRDYEVVGFPSRNGWAGPFKQSAISYNAGELRIATVDEYGEACIKRGRKRPSKSHILRAIASARTNLDSANNDERHWHRLQVAGLAAKAYASLFLLITGATPTEFDQFSYADALAVEKSPIKKELSAVKFRAGGRSTLYNIGRDSGLPLLKEYLKLRKWILNGAAHERLFFGMPSVTQKLSDNMVFSEFDASDLVFNFYDSISGAFLDPKIPRLSPRKMRKYKSVAMHTAGIAPASVSASLNHSESVNLSTYAEATPEQQDEELGRFWQAVRRAADIVRERGQRAAEGETATAAGHCSNFSQPIPMRDLGAVGAEVSCRTQYGCLYCENYLVHSDEEDLHKIMSLQYVINAVRKSAPDAAHAETLYKELSIRIEFILESICEGSDRARKTANAVKSKVFEYGELTQFWENRLNRYEAMGVVF